MRGSDSEISHTRESISGSYPETTFLPVRSSTSPNSLLSIISGLLHSPNLIGIPWRIHCCSPGSRPREHKLLAVHLNLCSVGWGTSRFQVRLSPRLLCLFLGDDRTDVAPNFTPTDCSGSFGIACFPHRSPSTPHSPFTCSHHIALRLDLLQTWRRPHPPLVPGVSREAVAKIARNRPVSLAVGRNGGHLGLRFVLSLFFPLLTYTPD